MRRTLSLTVTLLLLAVAFTFISHLSAPLIEDHNGPGPENPPVTEKVPGEENAESLDGLVYVIEGNAYSDRVAVAHYIYLFGELPPNYITKKHAETLGWESQKGNLWEVAHGKSIGGDRFGNREGLLPDEAGRIWYECDINYEGGYRGAERIVFSNDGLIFYTDNHYESFTQLYGEGD